MEIEQALREMKGDLEKCLRSELTTLEVIEDKNVFKRVQFLEWSLDDIRRRYYQKLRSHDLSS